MNPWLCRWWADRWAQLAAGPDRGAETVDKVLWIAVIIVVVGAVGLLFRDAVVDFFNTMVFEIGFGSGS
jgi:hypothetical protein